jgi:hypothetical protein
VVWTLHFVFVNTPSDTIDMYRRGLKALEILDPASYEISNALASVRHALTGLPRDLLAGTGGLIVAAFAALLLLSRRCRADSGTIAAAAALIFTGASLALAFEGRWVGGGSGYVVLATVGCSLVVCAVPLAVAAYVVERRHLPRPGSVWLRGAAVAAFLVLFAAAYAFGSGNGFYIQLNGGLALLFGAALLLVCAFIDLPDNVAVAGLLSVVMALGGANVLDSARDSPYRAKAMDEQTEPRSFGPHGSRMLLDPQTAGYLDELRSSAAASGFRAGMPMLDFTYYAASALYDLDALVPHSLIPTVGAYVATNDLARWSIGQLEPEIWHDAWLLTAPENPAAPDPSIVSLLGRSFPEDYELVTELRWWQRDELQQLWRPRQG